MTETAVRRRPGIFLVPTIVFAAVAAFAGACASPAEPGPPGTVSPVDNSPGQPWALGDVTYTVDWAAKPDGDGGIPGPHVEVDVRVDNRGTVDAHYPDPSVEYNGNAVALAGWTQPYWGALISPGQSADFRSAFPTPAPGGPLRVRVLAFVGDTETEVHWTGILNCAPYCPQS
jgi:hypothetical protein